MDKFIINEDEKNRILNLHQSATKRQYLPEQAEEIKQEEGKDKSTSGDVRTNHDRTYDYKKDGDKYFYKLKNATDWTTASGKGLEAIKTKVYGTGNPSKSGSNLGKSKAAFPFTDKVAGDKFRAWMNKYYPKVSKIIDLDKSGPFNNSYMKNAWNTSLNKEYAKTLKGPLSGVLTFGDLYDIQVLKPKTGSLIGQASDVVNAAAKVLKGTKNSEGYTLSKNQEAVGKVAYVKGDYVNYRTSPKYNSGLINNNGGQVKGKNKKIGTVKAVLNDSGEGSKKWYQIDMVSYCCRYVREDVVTLKNS